MISKADYIHLKDIRDVTFLTQTEFDRMEKRAWGFPTGRRIGRSWLQAISNTSSYVHFTWVRVGQTVRADISHVAIIEWENEKKTRRL